MEEKEELHISGAALLGSLLLSDEEFDRRIRQPFFEGLLAALERTQHETPELLERKE